MSLADLVDDLTWDALSPARKREAVLDLLICGRTVQETAEALSITYGTIGANHVRGVIDRHRLDEDQLVMDARRRRRADEAAAARARARHKKPARLARPPVLPKIPLQPGLSPSARQTGVTLLELKRGHCRAPLWDASAEGIEDKFYCGAPVKPGQSYCPACCARFHVPPAARTVFHTPDAVHSVDGRRRAP